MTTLLTTASVDTSRELSFQSGGEFSAYQVDGASTITLTLEEGYSFGATDVTLDELDQMIAYLTAVRAAHS